MRFETFSTLEAVANRIIKLEGGNADKMIWSNEAGEWDIGDIATNDPLYKECGYTGYVLDVVNKDILDVETYELLFIYEGEDL